MLHDQTAFLLRSFASETLEIMDVQEGAIEHLRSEDAQRGQALDTIALVFHTIKQNADTLGLSVVGAVTAEAQTLISLALQDNTPHADSIIPLIYESFDVLRMLLHQVAQTLSDAESGTAHHQLITNLQNAVQSLKEENRHIVSGSLSGLESARFSIDISPELDWAGADDIFSHIKTDMLSKYVVEAQELLGSAEAACLLFEQDPTNDDAVDEIFRAVHTLKGNSGFLGQSEIEGLAMDVENVLDAVRNKEIEVYSGLISVILSNLDVLKQQIQSISLLPSESMSEKTSQPVVEHSMQSDSHAVSGTASAAPIRSAIPQTSTTYTHAQKPPSTSMTFATSSGDQPLASSQPAKQQRSASPKTSAVMAQRQDIRVDTGKLDRLFNLVGELITIETMVTNHPDLAELELEGFQRTAVMLNKITRELQEVTMSIRMMPLDGLFTKMKRLVRDLSVKFSKKISLEISGAETEMDKNVIEEISDPLMHIIRNALDHGIEPTEKRLAAGKSETGIIALRAQYVGNEILIIIEDDGGGLHRERILAKAVANGLLKTASAGERLSDPEVWNFIFEPGFSTAEKVSDISGRGVGMDVVKRNIEKLQGSIKVESMAGRGTKFMLRIPLTLAIMDGMLIRVGDGRYALPILSIRESFRPTKEALTVTMDGLEMVSVRDEIFPVIRLHEMYQKQADADELDKGILIIVEAREKKACLFVDEIVGQQQIVVKGLSNYIGKVEGLTGCMILANGETGLIVDVDALLGKMMGSLVEY